MCGADFWTDHRLVVSKLNLSIQPARRPQGKKAAKKLNQASIRQAFLTTFATNWMQSISVFHKTVHSSSATALGHPSRKHTDRFDEIDDIQKLLEEKH